MRDVSPPDISARFVPTTPGVPDAQARALDRRRRLERQQRSFRGPRRGQPAAAPGRAPLTGPAGPAPG